MAARNSSRNLMARTCRSFTTTPAKLGIFDSLKDSWQGTKEQYSAKKQNEMFHAMIGQLIKKEKFDLDDFTESFKQGAEQSGMTGWQRHLPGVKNSPELLQLQETISVLDIIPPEFRREPEKLRAEEKARLAKSTGKTVTDINKVLKRYDEMKMLHGWLRKRAQAGKPLPTNSRELAMMALEPGSGFQMKMKMRR
uniref:Signal recognition particle SRP54 subunit M-domain domain-containing protein n=1 Tax=Hanusia phi TaxID=3032 RepID=A0A7S0HZ64_9CRYP